MSGDPERVYFDACVFLSLINANADRVPMIEKLVQECKENDRQIITSALSITEVAFAAAEQQAGSLDPAQLAKIDAFWAPESPYLLVELHQLVAQDARDLVRETVGPGHTLKAADAIHLASALRARATHFYTYDEKLLNLQHGHPIKIVKPALRTAQLEYQAGPADG